MKNGLHRRLRTIFLLVTALVSAGAAFGENVRGRVAGSVSDGGDAVSFRPEELVVIEAASPPAFQEGLELRLSIPAGLRRYQNSFALLIYRNVEPSPSTDQRSYRGTRTFMRLIPSRDSMFVRIPLNDAHSITGDALTDVLPVTVSPSDLPLFVTVQPVMKGIPDSAFSQTLEISAHALWKAEGTLTVTIANPSGRPDEIRTIMVDGNPIPEGEPVSLAAGIHRIRVESSLAPTVEKNIAVEPGEEADLGIELDYRSPELLVSVPDGAALLLDGEPISVGDAPYRLEVEPGRHTVTYRLGGMDVSRDFTIGPGGQMNIDLIIDINIVDFSESGGSPYGAGDG